MARASSAARSARSPGDAARRDTKPRAAATPARNLGFRIFRWTALVLVAGLFAGVATLAGVSLYFSAGLPDLESLEDYRPPVVTRVVDADGALLGEIFTERRTVVPFTDMPKVLVNAVLAAEDARFYEHKGLDYLGMVRAFLKNVAAGGFVQGGSTITQQVVKTFLLTPEKSLRRKAQEVILARRLEEAFGKDEILFLYLNQIYLGGGRYGVEAASLYYFGHGTKELTLAEAAMIAALPKAPVTYSPFADAAKAKTRRDWVLDRMVETGFVKAAEAAAAKRVELPVSPGTPPFAADAPEVEDFVRADLIVRFGEEALPSLGATVWTTIRAPLEKAARAALIEELRKLDKRRGYDKPRKHLDATAAWKKIAESARDAEPRAGELFEGIVVAVVRDTGDERLVVSLAGFLGELKLTGDVRLDVPGAGRPSARFKPGDLVPVDVAGLVAKTYVPRDLPAGAALLSADLADRLVSPVRFRLVSAMGPQGALVALDPLTRAIVALVGGAPFTPGGLDRATKAMRPPGSAFKPLLYTTAIASRKFTAATLVSDAPAPFADGYDPDNSDPVDDARGDIRLRIALARSVNTVAVRVLDKTGESALAEMARDSFGLVRPLHAGLAAALGTTEMTPLELCNAHAVLASGGKLGPPRLIEKILDRHGKVIWQDAPEIAQVLDPEVAYVVSSMMTSVVEMGTGRAARLPGRMVAGKTGTTNDGRNLWFGGFTPDLAAVVWVGFDHPTPVKKEFGGTVSAPAWRSFMSAALVGRPPSFFPRPPGVSTVLIDPDTGLRAWDGQPNALEEVFLAGTEPTETALPPGSVTVDDWAMGGGSGGPASGPAAGTGSGAPSTATAPPPAPRPAPSPAPTAGDD